MDRFRELSTFLAVAEAGAFNAAARRLALSPSVVTRLVNDLEARLGARLLVRTTRSLALTEAGRRLQDDAARILGDLAEAEATAAGAHQVPRGALRVTAPVEFGQRYILPILGDYLAAYPAVSASTVFLDRVVHLVEEGFDIALRIGALADSGMVALRVGQVRSVTVAAPDYITAHGRPATPADLGRHKIINTSNLHAPDEWVYHRGRTVVGARIAPQLTVNSVAAARQAALAGWGITRLLSYQVADALADGRLIELLEGWDDRRLPVHLVHAEGTRPAAKTRAFLDFSVPRLRADADRLAAV